MGKVFKYLFGTLLLSSIIGLLIISGTTEQISSLIYKELDEPAVEAPSIPPGHVVIKKLDLRKANVTTLAGEVGSTNIDIIIAEINEFNKNSSAPIYLVIDSPGGSVMDGARLITAMQNSRNPVYTICLQLCASMAAMTLEYGKQRYAIDRSVVMFHPASVGGSIQGELDKVVSRFSFLKRYVDKMDRYVSKRSGHTYADFKALSNQELWLDAEDALQNNYIDAIVDVTLPITTAKPFGTNKLKDSIKME